MWVIEVIFKNQEDIKGAIYVCVFQRLLREGFKNSFIMRQTRLHRTPFKGIAAHEQEAKD